MKPKQFEVAKSLAHRRLADAVVLGDAGFDQSIARDQMSAQDLFDEAVADVFAQDAAFGQPLERRRLTRARRPATRGL